jgi:hypothetical protein
MANLNFDANEVEPNSPLDPISDGNYAVVITESQIKSTKSGTGSYLQLTFEVIEGNCKGRLLWVRLNLDNPNATAVQIARQELSAICRAIDVMQPQDSEDLHNIPLIVDVRSKKRSDSNELTNVIKGYRKHGEGPGAVSTFITAPAAVAPVATTVGGPAPWKRG